jgi:hypothetical protein
MSDGKGVAIVWRSRNAGCRSQEAGTTICIGVDSDQQRQNNGDLGGSYREDAEQRGIQGRGRKRHDGD